MSRISSQELDNYITGHYGEDQFANDDDDRDWCFECALPSNFFADSAVGFSDIGLCARCAQYETENDIWP